MSAARPRLLLAASGGGHLRQLLDLEGVWSGYDHAFVTERSAIARDLAAKHRVHLVPHVALGQARLGRWGAMLWGGARNFARAVAIAFRERPDVVISTGAGTVAFPVLLARLLGARFVLIESFARFERPSMFGRAMRRLATATVVQSAAVAALWPDARLFDPFRVLDAPVDDKEDLALSTVGATLPFDRLSEAVLRTHAAKPLAKRLIVQTGLGSACAPRTEKNFSVVPTLDFADIKKLLERAELVICHGGTGSLVTALRAGCRVVAMPRRFNLGEVYDDHQREIVEAFAARGLVERCEDADDLPAAIARARARPPVCATTDASALAAWLRDYIEGRA